MSFQVSARRWRPQTFEEVIGQPHITITLKNAIEQGKIAQAYVFSGIRGVGKTTMARIFAKGLNCDDRVHFPCGQCDSCREITEGHSVDVVEIDGASNTGVDDVRELREMVKYLPLRGRYKVYIIDEVHMLSPAAFNALLKTLEEPPPHLVFILATTAPHKIPLTILSRCQHFTCRRLSRQQIVGQLKWVAAERGATFTEGGMTLISKAAEGSMRDALSMLDQAIAYGEGTVNEEGLLALFGRVGMEKFHLLVSAIHQQNAVALLGLTKEIADRGYDLRQFLSDWLEHLRHLILAQNVQEVESWLDLPREEVDLIHVEAAFFTREEMQRLFSLFARLYEDIRNAPHPHIYFEVAVLKAILLPRLQSVESLIQRLDALGGEGKPEALSQVTGQREPAVLTTRVSPLPVERGGSLPTPKTAPNPVDAPGLPLGGGVRPSGVAPLQKVSPVEEVLSPPDLWMRLLSEAKEQRPALGSYLEQGSLLEVGDGALKIGFSQKTAFLMPMIQKQENMDWMTGLLKAHFKKEVRVFCVEVPGSEKDASAEKEKEKGPSQGSHPSQGPHPSQESHSLQGPHPSQTTFLGEVLKVFGGEVIDEKVKRNG